MTLSCKDVDPSSDCDFKANGGTKDEVVSKMMNHVKSDHADVIASKNLNDAQLKAMLEAKVH